MIYIISGASRSGKTIVSKKLMNRISVPYMPVDSLMMGFMNAVPQLGIHDKLWPNEIAEKLWPFLMACIENMIFNEIDYIFEGEAFLPNNIAILSNKFPNKIKVCFLGYEEIKISSKVKDVKLFPNSDNDWLIGLGHDGIVNHITNMVEYSESIKNQCEKSGIQFFSQKSDFETYINKVVDSLSN